MGSVAHVTTGGLHTAVQTVAVRVSWPSVHLQNLKRNSRVIKSHSPLVQDWETPDAFRSAFAHFPNKMNATKHLAAHRSLSDAGVLDGAVLTLTFRPAPLRLRTVARTVKPHMTLRDRDLGNTCRRRGAGGFWTDQDNRSPCIRRWGSRPPGPPGPGHAGRRAGRIRFDFCETAE